MTISPNVVILIRRVCMNDGLDGILYYMNRIKYIKTFMQNILEQGFVERLIQRCNIFSSSCNTPNQTRFHHNVIFLNHNITDMVYSMLQFYMKIVNVEDTFSQTWKCLLSLVTLHLKCFIDAIFYLTLLKLYCIMYYRTLLDGKPNGRVFSHTQKFLSSYI